MCIVYIEKCMYVVCIYIYVCVIEFSGNYLQSQLLLISYNFHNFYFLNTNHTHTNHTHTNNTHKHTNEHIVKHKKGSHLKKFLNF